MAHSLVCHLRYHRFLCVHILSVVTNNQTCRRVVWTKCRPISTRWQEKTPWPRGKGEHLKTLAQDHDTSSNFSQSFLVMTNWCFVDFFYEPSSGLLEKRQFFVIQNGWFHHFFILIWLQESFQNVKKTQAIQRTPIWGLWSEVVICSRNIWRRNLLFMEKVHCFGESTIGTPNFQGWRWQFRSKFLNIWLIDEWVTSPIFDTWKITTSGASQSLELCHHSHQQGAG